MVSRCQAEKGMILAQLDEREMIRTMIKERLSLNPDHPSFPFGSMSFTKQHTFCPSFRTRASAIRNPGRVKRRLDSGLRRNDRERQFVTVALSQVHISVPICKVRK